jgi:ureidoglycolate lyase
VTKLIEIVAEPLTAEAFAPFGEIVGGSSAPTDWTRPGLDAWKNTFRIEGKTELRVMRYHRQNPNLHVMERHVTVTESRMPLGGARVFMVVAPPSPADRPDEAPPPEAARAFYLDGTAGLMLSLGTWHALDCYVIGRDYADFAFISEVATEDEIETSIDAFSGARTQITDYHDTHDCEFTVVDPLGLAGQDD